MKIGMIADLHLNLYRRFNPFFIHVETAVDEFVRLCKERKVEMIVIPGDFFHTKYQLSTEALIKANNILDKLIHVAPHVVIIRGNHDSASQLDLNLNLCMNYKKIPGVRIVNDYDFLEITNGPSSGVTFHFVAYAEGEELKQKVYDCQINKKHNNILFGHFAVQGFKMNGDYEDKNGLTQTNLLDAFKQVFLGHFHGHQHNKNIWYISSPLQSKHGDEDAQHGFMFYDSISNECEFVENKLSPKFITYDMNKENVKASFELTNHYVRFIVHKHISRDLLTTIRQKILIQNYDVEFRFNVQDDVLNFTSMEGFVDLKHYSIDELFTIYLQEIQTPDNTTTDQLLQAILN